MEHTDPQFQAAIQDGEALHETDQLKRYIAWYVSSSKGHLYEYNLVEMEASNFFDRLRLSIYRK
jgi:hypothetical protein